MRNPIGTQAVRARARAQTRRAPVVSPKAQPRPARVLSVRHALDILRCLAGDTPLLGVTDIASIVGLHKSSVSRMVATLAEDDLVERDAPTRRVRLGPGLLSLAAPLLGCVRIVDTAMPELALLAQRCGETISVGVWDGAGAVNLEQVLGGKAVKHYAAPGSRNPAHATAAGKLLLAYASSETFERVARRELRRFTPRTICTRAGLVAEVATIRRNGYAINEGEYSPDVGAMAAPIRNDKGVVIASISATVPMYRFAAAGRQPLIDLVLDAADRVSARLGFERRDHAR
ncbi:MAG TPA: IclR family transcriptional regulator [Casimicrobiaceae bacterium]|nr:IclR family transcriptional regulator [Casimicrobiaceae bacterium]